MSYSDERNTQIVLALLKAYKIKRVVVSPGSGNIDLVISMQNDPYFKLFSAVDERHAAYLACGMASESDEPVVISCTGATAARNYMPGMTEAYYRKLPILCITSSRVSVCVGHGYGEMTDRSRPPRDTAKVSVQLPPVFSDYEAFGCELVARTAMLELFGPNRGPVHINLQRIYKNIFNTKTLPKVRTLKRIYPWESHWPKIDPNWKIAIVVGSGRKFSTRESKSLERFIARYNAVALIDQASVFVGKGACCSSLICAQVGQEWRDGLEPDLVLHLGEISGDYPTCGFISGKAPVWRINADGVARDRYATLTNIFAMPEIVFFDHYSELVASQSGHGYLNLWRNRDLTLRKTRFRSLPFSSVWIANEMAGLMPKGSMLHLGILNSLRAWNYQRKLNGVVVSCNVGGFGIDGCTSTAIGASLIRQDRLCFIVTGDLAFFYDLNSLGNRHIGNNLRVLIVNNGIGGTFKQYFHPGSRFGSITDEFVAGGGHFGRQSKDLVRHYASDLGMKYVAATSKEEFRSVIGEFLSESDQSIVLECFVSIEDDTSAVKLIDGVIS